MSPRSQKKTGSFNPEIYRLRVSDRLAVLPEESYENCELGKNGPYPTMFTLHFVPLQILDIVPILGATVGH